MNTKVAPPVPDIVEGWNLLYTKSNQTKPKFEEKKSVKKISKKSQKNLKKKNL